MEAVVFLRPYTFYATGDVASFDDEKIAQLRGIKPPLVRKASAEELRTGQTPEAKRVRSDEQPKSAPSENVCVRFDKSWMGYNVGELAWFPKATTDQLIDARAAHEPTVAELKAIKSVAVEKIDRERPVPVRLLKQVPPNNKGEILWVPADTAAFWATKGIAERVDPAAAGEQRRVSVRVTKQGDKTARPEVPGRALVEGELIVMPAAQAAEWATEGIAEYADPADAPKGRVRETAKAGA